MQEQLDLSLIFDLSATFVFGITISGSWFSQRFAGKELMAQLPHSRGVNRSENRSGDRNSSTRMVSYFFISEETTTSVQAIHHLLGESRNENKHEDCANDSGYC
jgi:hypothetical protein